DGIHAAKAKDIAVDDREPVINEIVVVVDSAGVSDNLPTGVDAGRYVISVGIGINVSHRTGKVPLCRLVRVWAHRANYDSVGNSISVAIVFGRIWLERGERTF